VVRNRVANVLINLIRPFEAPHEFPRLVVVHRERDLQERVVVLLVLVLREGFLLTAFFGLGESDGFVLLEVAGNGVAAEVDAARMGGKSARGKGNGEKKAYRASAA
jgi:hypothetical protein